MESTYNNGLVDSSNYIICENHLIEQVNGNGLTYQLSSHPLGGNNQAKKVEDMSAHAARPMSALRKSAVIPIVKNQAINAKIATPIRSCLEPYCNVKLDAIIKLKDSTRKLLCLLEEIHTKTNAKDFPPPEIKVIQPTADVITSITDIAAKPELEKLEAQTKNLNTIYIEDEDDDCSIFKRLTRKCNCLNQHEYNDFVIHFNEDTKYFTSTIGEIIKNMRILKKFLYMGGRYTKNALIFLNEGLGDSAHEEKVEITQGCSHSDMCNVFEDHSIVIMCISWPCKLEHYGDNVTQNLAASFLYKLAQLEEGRRYLKFTSRITNDIKKVLRKKGSKLDMDTTESLNSTINMMHPPMTQNVNVINYCRQYDEVYGSESIKALKYYRMYMTLDEVFTHLDLLHKISREKKGKIDLTSFLPDILLLFKDMLKEYDNSEMNIIVTNILNNIVSKNMLRQKEIEVTKQAVKAVDTATEPVKMKNEIIQMPPPAPTQKKNNTRKGNKSKSHVGAPNKFRQISRRKVSEFENPVLLNTFKKFNKERSKNIIVVPIE